MAGGSTLAIHPVDHTACFYEDDAQLVARAVGFAGDGLESGDAIVIAMTEPHRRMLADAIAGRGIDIAAARADGRYIELDAADTLAAITSDGRLDSEQFAHVIGAQLEHLDSSTRVRAVGEIVALLWEAGALSAVIELEAMWNDLARERPLSLLCAYPMTAVTDDAELTMVSRICDQHSHVDAPATASPATDRPATTTTASRIFLPVPTAIGAARRFVAATLGTWGFDEATLGDAVLVASELATNALLHARSPFRVTLERKAKGAVRISLFDASETMPSQRTPSSELSGGRGIALVDTLTEAWGAERHSDGKVVWGELAASS